MSQEDEMNILAQQRTVRLRCTIEELISSEESYITDLKVLLNTYFPLLTSVPSRSPRVSSSQVLSNVTEILKLHEEILGQLRDISPKSRRNLDQSTQGSLDTKRISRRSHDKHRGSSASMHAIRLSLDSHAPTHSKIDTPAPYTQDAMMAATVFDRMMDRFFIYEEYGSQYEIMRRDMATSFRSVSNWQDLERRIEALANNSFASSTTAHEKARKSLTFEDLLIKPIQRVCRYPLIFAELHKHTPDVDGTETRAALEKVLCRLRETAQEINKAIDDQATQARTHRSLHRKVSKAITRAKAGSIPSGYEQMKAKLESMDARSPRIVRNRRSILIGLLEKFLSECLRASRL